MGTNIGTNIQVNGNKPQNVAAVLIDPATGEGYAANTLAVTIRTPSLSRSSASGAVASGAKSVVFANAGATNATVAGAALKPGERVTFSTEGADVLGAISYDATGTELAIAKVV